MFIYSVTVGIDQNIEETWVQWMLEKHIPEVMKTGMFIDSKMFKVLHEEPGNLSYNIQYYAETLGHIETYLSNFAEALIQEHNARFKHVAFRTLLQQVEA